MKLSIAGLLLMLGTGLPVSGAQASEIRVGFIQDALTLDPANPGDRNTEVIIRNMYDGLVTRDPAMKVVPQLAQSWRQLDPVTYEFTLRPGLHFHDGSPLTAKDVKFALDRVLIGKIGGQTNPRRDLLGPLKRVEIVDPLTVRLVLSVPWPVLPAMLPFEEIVSEAYVKKNGDQGLVTEEDGTGPFRLKQWDRGDTIVMERVPDYYGGSPDIPPAGPAHVDRVIYKIMPNDAARVSALLAGDVDIINSLPVTSIRRVEADPDTRVETVNSTRTFFVAINTARPPFNDVRVRQALNYAVDRKLIVAKLLDGLATPLNGVLSPDAFGFDPNLPDYPYDPAKARALLVEAGVHDLHLTIDTDGANKGVAEAIASLLSRSGITAKVQVWELAVLTPIWRNAAKRKDHDLLLTSWGNATLEPSDIMMPTIRSGGRANTAGYSNPEVDKLLDSAETEQDRDKRRALYFKVQEQVHADAPWVFLWLPRDVYGVSKRVHGWRPRPDGMIDLSRASVE
ncbi:ABC transporter substrate-binding protein [Paraburkholderia sp. JPY419]|uniref:ABC transporter substrate-binding protein n=1 Tax=Paraburkholderia sp. JPY419 TaxID=667660 RepID=UPI003D236209